MAKVGAALSGDGLLALVAITIIGIIVLLAMGKTIPQELWGVVALLTGGKLVAVVPTSSTPPATSAPTPGAPT